MTNSTITREQLIEKLKHRIAVTEKYPHLEEAQIDSQIFKIALAAMDSEPVAYTDERNLGYIDRGRETAYLWGKQNSEGRDVPLYRHAQPAPSAEILRIADALEGQLWPNMTIGNREVIQAAIEALRTYPAQQPVVQCPYPCGWDNLNKLAIQDAALVARGLVEGEPTTEAHRQAAISNNDRLLKVITACRAAMLQAGNSPVIPAGYVMVPTDLLSELRDLAHPEIEEYCEIWKGRRDSEFPALRKVIADADALLAAAQKEVKS